MGQPFRSIFRPISHPGFDGDRGSAPGSMELGKPGLECLYAWEGRRCMVERADRGLPVRNASSITRHARTDLSTGARGSGAGG